MAILPCIWYCVIVYIYCLQGSTCVVVLLLSSSLFSQGLLHLQHTSHALGGVKTGFKQLIPQGLTCFAHYFFSWDRLLPHALISHNLSNSSIALQFYSFLYQGCHDSTSLFILAVMYHGHFQCLLSCSYFFCPSHIFTEEHLWSPTAFG